MWQGRKNGGSQECEEANGVVKSCFDNHVIVLYLETP